jgi:hypothetical protein
MKSWNMLDVTSQTDKEGTSFNFQLNVNGKCWFIEISLPMEK